MNKILEEVLIEMWGLTKSIRGCKCVIKILQRIAEYADDEEIEDVLFCQNLAFAKGQSLRLIENQKSFVGDL